MEYKFNKSIINLKQSDIRKMTINCDKLGGINLSQGICDLDLPVELIDGVNIALKKGYNIYSRYNGLKELRNSVSKKLNIFNQIDYCPETEIVITSGTSAAFFLCLKTLFEKGDELIIFQPFYGYHYNTALSLDVNPKIVDLESCEDLAQFKKNIKHQITSKTRAILINTPGNPSGKVFTEKEISVIGEIAIEHNLLIITDEIYEYITFDNKKHISPANVEGLKDITVTIGGFSKTYSITGWRIGYLAANKKITEKIGVLNDLYYICPPTPLQKAVSYAIDNINKNYYNEIKKFYQKNRDLIVETLLTVGFKVKIPEGAYYLLADHSGFEFKNSVEAADYILAKTKVATVPGKSFYDNCNGDKYVRFCFAKKYDILKQACENLKQLQ